MGKGPFALFSPALVARARVPHGRPGGRRTGLQQGGAPTGGAAVFPEPGRRLRSSPPGSARCCALGVAPRPGRADRSTPLAASSPFLLAFTLNPAAPASVLTRGPPPGRPSRARGFEFRTPELGTVGLPLTHPPPPKPPTDAAPPPSLQEALSPKQVALDAPRSERALEGARLGRGRSEATSTHKHPQICSAAAPGLRSSSSPSCPPPARARPRALAPPPSTPLPRSPGARGHPRTPVLLLPTVTAGTAKQIRVPQPSQGRQGPVGGGGIESN